MTRKLSIVFLSLLLIACGDRLLAPDRTPTTLDIDRYQLELFEGEADELSVTMLDQGGVAFADIPAWTRVEWSSLDPSIVQVEGSQIVALKPGLVTVEARAAGKVARAQVRVRQVVTGFELDEDAFTVLENGSRALPLVARDARGDTVKDADLAFSAANPSLATVTPEGMIHGVFPGNTHIELQLVQNGPGELLSFELPVRVRAMVTSFAITPDSARLRVGETVQLSFEARDARGDLVGDVEVDVSTNRPDLISIGADNEVTLLAPGLAQIRTNIENNGSGGVFHRSVPVRINPHELSAMVTGVHFTQGVQRSDGGIPLVARRPGTMRIFAQSSSVNFFPADVVVRLSATGMSQRTIRLAGADGYPAQSVEGVLTSTWNVAIPDSLIRPGLQVQVEVEPWTNYPLLAGSQLTYPASGGWLSYDVRVLPPLRMTFIPIHQSALNSTVVVPQSTVDEFMETVDAMFPVGDSDAIIRAPYTTTLANGSTSNWNGIIQEIRTLHMVEGTDRHYYGILQNIGTNTSGLGYIAYPVSIGIGTPVTYAAEVFVHELGHNFGRYHAPCGGPANVDPQYPHPGAAIAVWGFNWRTNLLLTPNTPDIMSYCFPAWASDYTYNAVLNFRQSNFATAQMQAARTAPERSLVVWGSIRGDRVSVEPAFVIEARPVLPRPGGAHRLEGRDTQGRVLFSYAFDADEVGDAAVPEQQFSFAIPARLAEVERLAELRVVANGLTGRRTVSARSLTSAPEVTLERSAPGRVRLRWDAAAHPMLLVRDQEGVVLSFARGGDVEIRASSDRLRIDASSGTRSVEVAPVRAQ